MLNAEQLFKWRQLYGTVDMMLAVLLFLQGASAQNTLSNLYVIQYIYYERCYKIQVYIKNKEMLYTLSHFKQYAYLSGIFVLFS